MFDVNILNGLEPLKIYLTKPDQTILHCINAFIDKDSAQLSPAFNQTYDLSFNIYRYMCDRNGNKIEFAGYDYIVDGMYLSVEKFGNFRINNPESLNTPDNEYKSVTATSCDYELVQKNFKYQINTGTQTSLEYLVEYEDGEQEKLVDPYTGIPYDWILLYNTIPEQLNAFKSKLDSGYFGTFSNSTISVTDSNKISEIVYILDLVKRLKRTITYNESGEVSSSTDNFEYAYDENNDISEIIIYDTVNSRLSDVIAYYNKYYKQLSLLHFISDLTDGNWTVGEVYGLSDGDYTYANKKIQFDEDGTIYSFLTQSLPRAIECASVFDIIYRKINIQPIKYIGENTGGIISFNKLINSLNISCDESNLITKLYIYGEDDLSIEQVNFGREYIEDLTYMVNAKDSDGNRIYVSDALADKYLQYKEYQEANRVDYIQLTKEYNQYLKEIDELKYRVPNDSLSTNWGSFTLDELETELTTYKNLLASLISLYKEDYGTVGCNEDGSVNENYIKNTEYWYDYYAYVNTIKQIEVAINTYPNYNNESKWTETQQSQYEGIKDDYLTEWSLYGSVELKVKIDSYASKLEVLVVSGAVIKKENSEYEIKTWDELSDLEKEDFLTEQSYIDSYNIYMEYYNYMTEAQSYLGSILAEISALEEKQNICKTKLDVIKEKVSWDKYFTSDERKILNKMLYEGEYNNNNILTTSINDVVDSVDIQNELLLDGQEKISILSRPQLIFNTELSNIFGLIEFKPLWDDFKILNYILVQYRDNKFAKLRLTGFSFNPLIPSTQTISVSFSNMVSSKTKFDDTASILGLSSTEGLSTYGSNSSSSGNGSSGIDNISNTMLDKLLNSETFGTRVTNVILDTMSANIIQAKKAIIGGIAGDNTEIDGKRITTGWIMSGSYNGNKDTGSINNTKGSILNLENDCFNLGGGSIIYDGTVLRFGEDVCIAWSNVTGTDNVANKDDIPSDEYITQITKDTITTSYINALEITAKEVSADWVYAGDIKADQIYGGSLTLGGQGNTNGMLVIKNAAGDIIVQGDNSGLTVKNGSIVADAITSGTLDASKITVNGLIVGENVSMGDNATITWSQVSDADEQATQITKDTVTTSYVNALNVKAKEVSTDWVYAGNIKASQIYGDTLTLGGNNNANGQLVIKDASGNTIVTGNKDGLVINKGSISWSNVTGTDNVANKDDIPDDEYITNITKDTITTSYIEALDITVKRLAAETGTIAGLTIESNRLIVANGDNVTFSISNAGAIRSVGSSKIVNGDVEFYPFFSALGGILDIKGSSTPNISDSTWEYGGFEIDTTMLEAVSGGTGSSKTIWLRMDNRYEEFSFGRGTSATNWLDIVGKDYKTVKFQNGGLLYLDGSLYMGDSLNYAEKNIYFKCSGGTYQHDCKMYGANGESKTGIGWWDVANNRAIWCYDDVNNLISSNAQLKISALTVTMDKTNTSAISSYSYVIPFLKLVIFQVRFTVNAIAADTAITLGTISSDYAPSIAIPLSAYSNNHKAGSTCQVYMTSAGNIQYASINSIDSGRYLYLSGVWNYA